MTNDVGFEQPRVSGEASDYWPGKTGTFRGILTGFAKGPEFERKDKDGSTKIDKTVRWMFDIYKLDGSRVMYTPEEGDNAGQEMPAEKDALSSLTISNKSKAGEWFMALLGDVDFATVTAEELMEAAIGKEALLVLGPGTKGDRIVVKTVARFDD